MKPSGFRTRLPFHAYSSQNKKGRRPHPLVFKRRERALTLWALHRSIDQIAVELDVSNDTVRNYVAWGRKHKDQRAERGPNLMRIMQANARRRQIRELARKGMRPAEIALMVGCHERLVKMRLREQRSA